MDFLFTNNHVYSCRGNNVAIKQVLLNTNPAGEKSLKILLVSTKSFFTTLIYQRVGGFFCIGTSTWCLDQKN
jgi:hypothetical protein